MNNIGDGDDDDDGDGDGDGDDCFSSILAFLALATSKSRRCCTSRNLWTLQ